MKSRTMEPFWDLYAALPLDVKRSADSSFQRFQQDPFHLSLHFKEVSKRHKIFSQDQ